MGGKLTLALPLIHRETQMQSKERDCASDAEQGRDQDQQAGQRAKNEEEL